MNKRKTKWKKRRRKISPSLYSGPKAHSTSHSTTSYSKQLGPPAHPSLPLSFPTVAQLSSLGPKFPLFPSPSAHTRNRPRADGLFTSSQPARALPLSFPLLFSHCRMAPHVSGIFFLPRPCSGGPPSRRRLCLKSRFPRDFPYEKISPATIRFPTLPSVFRFLAWSS